MPKSVRSHPLVITVDRNRLLFCSPVSQSILSLPLPEAVISDLEVIDRTKLESVIAGFVAQNKISPAPLVIVLSQNVYFDQTITVSPPEDIQTQTERFLDTVPLPAVSSKLFKWENGHRLVVINRDLYETVADSFKKLGFTVLAVVPGFILSPIGAKEDLDRQACRIILNKIEYLKENSFLSDEHEAASFKSRKNSFLRVHQLPLLLVSLLVTAVSIGTLVYLALRPAAAPPVITPPRPTPVAASPTPAPILSPAASPSAVLTPATTRIQVLNASGVTGQATKVAGLLKDAGFPNVQTGNASSSSARSLVILSPDLTPTAKAQIVSSVKVYYQDVAVQENRPEPFDVVIQLGLVNAP